MNSVLLVAYHFPPLRVSSGIQRTLSFSRYLPEFGWRPLVLTVDPRAYEATSPDQLADVADSTNVTRAYALDTARHLAVRGRYVDWMAQPDRWISWWPAAVLSGLRLIRRHRPSVIWSTYPIATAHLAALTLSRLSGLPWVADFRDSMTEPGYPREPARRKTYLWIERHTVRACTRAVFTTPGALTMYASRYPDLPGARWAQIANGYDEAIFEEVEDARVQGPGLKPEGQPVHLVHSGTLYPAERDPKPFFSALSSLLRQGLITPQGLKITLRASAHDELYAELIERAGISDIVELAPGLPYRAALEEMLNCDGLLLFQAPNCNHQIPAKLYEYLRADKPILALTDSEGDTAAVVRDAGLTSIVPLDDADAIEAGLRDFVESIRTGRARRPSQAAIAAASRRERTRELAELLEQSRTE